MYTIVAQIQHGTLVVLVVTVPAMLSDDSGAWRGRDADQCRAICVMYATLNPCDDVMIGCGDEIMPRVHAAFTSALKIREGCGGEAFM